jgi:hypothetical protein
MTVSGVAQVIVGGGFSMNDLIMNGGTLQVLDQNPPPGEDPVLNRSLVAGYLHDGAMFMNAGTVTTPNLKIGVSPGFIGSLTMNGGTLSTANLLAANGSGTAIAVECRVDQARGALGEREQIGPGKRAGERAHVRQPQSAGSLGRQQQALQRPLGLGGCIAL